MDFIQITSGNGQSGVKQYSKTGGSAMEFMLQSTAINLEKL